MEIEVHFEHLKEVIEKELLSAKSSVYIAVAWINFKDYEDIFQSLIKNNVQINIICSDNDSNRNYLPEINNLQIAGAKVKLLEMPNTKNHMHHKFAIIDRSTVLNGSFNWSTNASKSFENIIVLRDTKEEAKKFYDEFKKLELIEKNTVEKLQTLKKCESCENGELVNILVFSKNSSKYFETSGDIVEVCTDCDHYYNGFDLITNNSLYILAESFNSSDGQDFLSVQDSIYDELNQYINNDKIIHAIGQVYHCLTGRDEDELGTKILWKNKFVGEKILDDYPDQDFEVNYDSTNTYNI
ncbi:phospholipase D-like domain-containing protein [Chryseobacterium sp. sg2396]|uniref:phospholipase D-like domain-containing protein n=1 Tax=Chryseobacterium sp. sg2396 TaxID=3276280 RepID=UPI0026010814|nr:phospholipase D-like domain-containing protein [uncultured Chryseobacterium sp.]